MWVLIDNYDSFTYILHHYLLQCGAETVVYKNDELTVDQLKALNPSRIIISPGPETPLQAGICLDVIREFHGRLPILGICLGHQALGMHFGAKLVHAPYPMHGKVSQVDHNGHAVFNTIPSPFPVMRYHSLVLEGLEETGLQVLSKSLDDHTVMAIAHETHPCMGIQFHPESIGTEAGLQILQNWAALY
jgi:anthranilate synthase/aminodeoxychorismate synthase-like glutamine amidotransferase